jgi:phosphoglycerate dehydrogenase-like enzyme
VCWNLSDEDRARLEARCRVVRVQSIEDPAELGPALRAMRSSACLFNVGRGETLDDAVVVAALQAGAIAGTALDVFDPEPLPPEHPYWSLPNVVVTPHVSGYTPNYFQRVLALFEGSLVRFLDGRPLRNVVDKQLGYVRDGGEENDP